jgi:hypothetical protein
MAQTNQVHLTPEQQRIQDMLGRYVHIAIVVMCLVLAVGVLYIAGIYLLTSR